MLCPCSQKYLASRLPFKVLLIWDYAPGHPEPQECSTKGVEVVSCPQTMSVSQPLDQGVIRTLRLITQGTLWERLSVLWKRTPTEKTSWEPRRLTPSKMPSLLQKRPWKPSSPKQYILLEKHCPDVHDFTGQSQSGNSWKRLWIGQKRWDVKGFKIRVLETVRVNRHCTRSVNSRPLDPGECFWTSARRWRRRCRRNSARKHSVIWQCGRRVPIIQDFLTSFMAWTVLWYGHWNENRCRRRDDTVWKNF